MNTRLATPGEGSLVHRLLSPAARSWKDAEDLAVWCDLLDMDEQTPVDILVCERNGSPRGAVLLRKDGLRCADYGADQIQELNRVSLYVSFLAVERRSPYGCGKELGDAAIRFGRDAGYRALTLLIPDERLYRYYLRLWPDGIYSGAGAMNFFLRTPTEDVRFPDLFRMGLPSGTRMGVCPLVSGVREEIFSGRSVVVGMTEDYRPEHAELTDRVSSLLRTVSSRGQV